jgi:hypothetical protein
MKAPIMTEWISTRKVPTSVDWIWFGTPVRATYLWHGKDNAEASVWRPPDVNETYYLGFYLDYDRNPIYLTQEGLEIGNNDERTHWEIL